VVNERPHTISTAYEKGGHHQRPALSVYTFQPLEHDSADSSSSSSHPVEYETLKRCKDLKAGAAGSAASSQESFSQSVGRPPLPQRCSSLERPVTTKTKEKVNKKNALVLPPTHGGNDSLLPDFHQAAPDMSTKIPVFYFITSRRVLNFFISFLSSCSATRLYERERTAAAVARLQWR